MSKICALPWMHLSIQQNGDVRACCRIIDAPFGRLQMPGEPDTCMNVTTNSFDEMRNHPVVTDIRSSMLRGEEHPACSLCWKEEEVGLPSGRLWANTIVAPEILDKIVAKTAADGTIDPLDFPVNYFDIRFGNLCNLKCRYCGPSDSSLWYEDAFKLADRPDGAPVWFYGKDSKYKIQNMGGKYEMDTKDFEWYEDPAFWTTFEKNIHNVDRIYLTGGEPSINKAHFKLLELLIEKGIAGRVHLDYNTNMFAIPEKLYALWSHFKQVELGCSIDATGDLAYYLRPPSKWKTLEKNLDRLGYSGIQNIRGSLSTTVSVYNIRNYLELCQWMYEKRYTQIRWEPTFHMLHGPNYANVKVLPLEEKKKIRNEYEAFYVRMDEQGWPLPVKEKFRAGLDSILRFMESEDLSMHLDQLADMTKKIDQIRGQSVRDSVPWLADILEL